MYQLKVYPHYWRWSIIVGGYVRGKSSLTLSHTYLHTYFSYLFRLLCFIKTIYLFVSFFLLGFTYFLGNSFDFRSSVSIELDAAVTVRKFSWILPIQEGRRHHIKSCSCQRWINTVVFKCPGKYKHCVMSCTCAAPRVCKYDWSITLIYKVTRCEVLAQEDDRLREKCLEPLWKQVMMRFIQLLQN